MLPSHRGQKRVHTSFHPWGLRSSIGSFCLGWGRNSSKTSIRGNANPLPFRQTSRLLRSCVALFYCRPVDDIPESGHVIRTAILVLQVVGVLPDIEPHHN